MIVYSEPFQKKYEAPASSSAAIFFYFCVLVILVVPFVGAYFMGGFWLKQNSWREQPNVHFTKEVILNLYSDDSVLMTWSSNPIYNKYRLDTLGSPVVKTIDVDYNFDGIIDWVDYEIAVPLGPTAGPVKYVQLAIFLDYQLSAVVPLSMQSLAIVDASCGISASSLQTVGNLKMRQVSPMPSWKTRNLYNNPVINWTLAEQDPQASSWSTLIESYMSRNDITIYDYEYPVWKSGKAADQPFKITGRIRFTEDEFFYLPGGWELFKWAWIQYFCLLVIVAAIVFPLMGLMFKSQLIPTFIKADRVPAPNGPPYTRLKGSDTGARTTGTTFKQYTF